MQTLKYGKKETWDAFETDGGPSGMFFQIRVWPARRQKDFIGLESLVKGAEEAGVTLNIHRYQDFVNEDCCEECTYLWGEYYESMNEGSDS